MKSTVIRVTLFLLVALVSLLVLLFATDQDVLKSVAQVPFVAGLLGALFQLIRDDAAHFRAQQLQQSKDGFVLGVESHMSRVAFDKHVAFCEAYGAEIHRTLDTLYRCGASAPGYECAGRLFLLRIQYAVWLPDDIQEQLKPFEDTLRKMQAESDLARALVGEADSREKRADALEKAAQALRAALGENYKNQQLPREKSYHSALDALKSMVGSEFLLEMRDRIRNLHRPKAQ